MKNKILFIFLNVFSSLIAFVKSFFFLKFLDDSTLGIIVLFQAVIAIFGLFQIGLLNGGYRIFSIKIEEQNWKSVNNLIISFICSLIALLTILGTIIGVTKGYNIGIIIFGVFVGGLAILQNWFTNIFIAREKLSEVNWLNILSNIGSLAIVPLIFVMPVFGALIAISGLYIFFVFFALVRNVEIRPTAFLFNKILFKRILVFGFVPYLTGIIYIINNQVDRFFIQFALSTEYLGKFYLAFTFISLFYMVPASINNLFFPSAMNQYTLNNIKGVFNSAVKYFLTNLLYSILALIGVFLFADLFVNLLFPEKIYQLQYVYYLLPGLIAMILSAPISLVLNVAFHYKSIMIGQVLALFLYLMVLSYMANAKIFSLEYVAWCKSFQGVFVLVYYIFAFMLLYKGVKHRKYLKE